ILLTQGLATGPALAEFDFSGTLERRSHLSGLKLAPFVLPDGPSKDPRSRRSKPMQTSSPDYVASQLNPGNLVTNISLWCTSEETAAHRTGGFNVHATCLGLGGLRGDAGALHDLHHFVQVGREAD